MKLLFLTPIILILPIYSYGNNIINGDNFLSNDYITNEKAETPGIILKKTVVQDNYELKNASKTLKVIYSSTDGITKKIRLNSGIILFPHGEKPNSGWPILSWQHGTAGTADVCAPSWTGPDLPSKEMINKWLGLGYAVIAADYQGLGTEGIHPYLSTTPTAYSVLDLLNASLRDTTLGLQNNILLYGWSQGAFATVATTTYVDHYAPELNIVAAAASGTPFLNKSTFKLLNTDKVNPTSAVSYVTYISNSLSLLHEDIDMDSLFKKKGLKLNQKYGNYCVEQFLKTAYKQKITFNQVVQDNAFNSNNVLEKVGYKNFNKKIPLFLTIGENDHDVPTDMQLALTKKMCSEGLNLKYKLYPKADHVQAFLESADDTEKFFQSIQKNTQLSIANTLNCK
ncbi:lipase family protein [Acinetobacter faecalis]|uniref:lipase family protein n=1 Tax=Acinetobacter faecalis TaxID=2665161 RepID=UPI002A918360|nr:lipase family protein [Acinetobacter faecalis]MDY6457341.1 lipase family protein [Acinetobacter faecalis]MDY6469302.1 lipase family protein [Acinetobacter faecalis]